MARNNRNGSEKGTSFAPWALAVFAVVVIEAGRFFLGGSVRAVVVEAQYNGLREEIKAVEGRLGKRIDRVEDALLERANRP